MITIKNARKTLGIKSKKYIDAEIQDALNQFYGLAEIIAEMITENSGSNKQLGVIDSPNGRRQNGKR